MLFPQVALLHDCQDQGTQNLHDIQTGGPVAGPGSANHGLGLSICNRPSVHHRFISGSPHAPVTTVLLAAVLAKAMAAG